MKYPSAIILFFTSVLANEALLLSPADTQAKRLRRKSEGYRVMQGSVVDEKSKSSMVVGLFEVTLTTSDDRTATPTDTPSDITSEAPMTKEHAFSTPSTESNTSNLPSETFREASKTVNPSSKTPPVEVISVIPSTVKLTTACSTLSRTECNPTQIPLLVPTSSQSSLPNTSLIQIPTTNKPSSLPPTRPSSLLLAQPMTKPTSAPSTARFTTLVPSPLAAPIASTRTSRTRSRPTRKPMKKPATETPSAVLSDAASTLPTPTIETPSELKPLTFNSVSSLKPNDDPTPPLTMAAFPSTPTSRMPTRTTKLPTPPPTMAKITSKPTTKTPTRKTAIPTKKPTAKSPTIVMSDHWNHGSYAVASTNNVITIRAPPDTEVGDTLFLFLSRTDDFLPIKMSQWKRGAECFKTNNAQVKCFKASDCILVDGNYCTKFREVSGYEGNGRDLATVLFYLKVSVNTPDSWSVTLRGTHPTWAIITAIPNVNDEVPINQALGVGRTSCDKVAGSMFPSVYGVKDDVLLLAQAFDDNTDSSRFTSPVGTSRLGWIRSSDEAGFLFGKVLTRTGQTGELITGGLGGAECKDALLSVVVNIDA